VFSLIDYEPPHYMKSDGKYKYPWWAETVGWGIASLSLVCIPAFAIYVFVQSDGATFREVSLDPRGLIIGQLRALPLLSRRQTGRAE
jgi:hypothetical protein